MTPYRVSYWDTSAKKTQHVFFSSKSASIAINCVNASIEPAHQNKTVAIPVSKLSSEKSTSDNKLDSYLKGGG